MTVTERVENILKVSKNARNSDRELLIIYMQKSGMNLSDEQIKIFRKLPSMETIRRIRQKLQENGKYLADKGVEEQRYNKFKQVKQNIKHESPEKLLEKLGYKVLEWGE